MSQPAPVRAAVIGLAGQTLSSVEADLFAQCPPAGVILFGRNIGDPDQLAALMSELREVLPPESVRMVDQEGGRVARMRPPHWRPHPACGALGSERAAWLQGALIGEQARHAGFDVVCAPVLDVRHPGASDVVGDRAFSDDPEAVARMGAAMASGLLAAGVQPVAKHAPGHGGAMVDSHHALPHVDGLDQGDLLPFATNLFIPWWMTAHVVPDGIDDVPASLSRRIVTDLLRDRLGYAGVIVSDDLAMGALCGSPAERAIGAWDAGCDLALYCPGDEAGTRAVLEAAPVLSEAARQRLMDARALAERSWAALDRFALAAERDALVAQAA